MTTIPVTKAKRFKIALSFPGEKRDYVEQVAKQLAASMGKNRVLYDQYYEAEFARPDLDTYLQRLYHDESELIAVFLCADYASKEWCGLEWRAVKDLIKKRCAADIMPLRFDDTEIPGLFSIDGYVWIDSRPAEEIAALILQRHGGMGSLTAPAPTPGAAAPFKARGSTSAALAIWQEKLEFLRQQEAICASATEKFSIRKHIEEAEAKIKDLS